MLKQLVLTFLGMLLASEVLAQESLPVRGELKIISCDLPFYPIDALKAKIEGTFAFSIVIDSTGVPINVFGCADSITVSSISKSKFDTAFYYSAAGTFAKGLYAPAMREGKPVKTEVLIAIAYRIQADTGVVKLVDTAPFKKDWESGITFLGATPSFKHIVRPTYPTEATEKKLEGKVRIKILIGTNGKPIKTEFEDGEKIFYQSAVDAAMQSSFFPALDMAGLPVKAWMILPMKFSLQ